MNTSGGYLTLLVLLSLPPLSCADEVKVQIRLLAADALEVSYALPPQCERLPFNKNGSAGRQIRATWQAQDNCGSADGELLSRSNHACPVLRFRVPTTTAKFGYPAAFPLSGGVYVHTGNYAVDESCGKVSYRFVAPGIATAGGAFVDVAADERIGGDTSALLMQTPMAPGAGTLSHFDPRLAASAVAQIKEVADGTVSYLRTVLPDAAFRAPILAAVAASAPGGPNIAGNAGDVLLAEFYNWPDHPAVKEQRMATLLISHEFSHRFQLRDAVDIYPDARLIHEGGAEFLRWVTSIQKGWLTRQQAAEDVDNALAECVLHANRQNWRALTARMIGSNRLEYRCGLPVYVFALAGRQGSDSALKRVNDFYRAVGQGLAPDFHQALECGADKNCRARWLPRLLTEGDSMEAEWAKLFSETHLALPQRPTQAQRDVMVLQAVVQLMRDDCGGASSTTNTADAILLDGLKACKTLRTDQHITRIENLPVFGNELVGPAMTEACLKRREITLGMKNGASLAVACAAPYRMRDKFYAIDIEKVLASLMLEAKSD